MFILHVSPCRYSDFIVEHVMCEPTTNTGISLLGTQLIVPLIYYIYI